ncbi:HhH-GPD family protein [Actinoalloteichus hymeniacidonis]|uniref:Adenine DNA glycosylase n=1 Tax=Actinoalloteichus hymeniacidonis TaxID=340345 RepID=A0AAC9HKW3_9PSEU|nr:A/G-specific adenine glycosylase [Actinoalloteichus hymeniacidonis]AOS61193.1 A/G-specific DNA-adenine glycosylase [Actinoalloteichus hymeniacidonis]MBB5910806.1 A/G-specific adenine glycosylase [Actinoalloteichus hymeniacidonis]
MKSTVLAPTTLIAWFDRTGRDLPWRHPETTGWGVLVSEIMLQQTPVVRVQPIWQDWMQRWPKPSSLAEATAADVLRAWGKLGYPRRALRLHAAAAAIAKNHGDVVPSDVDTLLALPGIGAYTARAVAAFAYGRRAPVVDTNVRRVVARAVHGSAEAGPPSTTRDLADVDTLLPEEDARAARYSAALMELGALVCTARNPTCVDCPVRVDCAWQQAGKPAYAGPTRPTQRFAGTDRQVRGLLLDVLRGASGPVERAKLDLVWQHDGQRDRCLDSLLVDGLAEQTEDGLFALPGES